MAFDVADADVTRPTDAGDLVTGTHEETGVVVWSTGDLRDAVVSDLPVAARIRIVHALPGQTVLDGRE